MQKLFQQIDRLQEEYLRFWTDICNTESISSDRPAVNRVADQIEDFCNERGFSVSRHSFEKAGDYLIVDMNEENAERVSFSGTHGHSTREGKIRKPCGTARGRKAIRSRRDRLQGRYCSGVACYAGTKRNR